VHAVKGKHDHHREIGNEQQRIEDVGSIKVLKGLIAIVGAEVVLQAVRRGQPEGQRMEAVRERYRDRWSGMDQGRASAGRFRTIVRDGVLDRGLRGSP